MEQNGLDLIDELIKNESTKEHIKRIKKSIFDRLDNAKYHYQEYKRLSNVKGVDAIKLALSLEDKEIKERIAIIANLTACIHNIHIIYDYLGNLIFHSLNLKISCNIYLSTVMEKTELCTNADYQVLLNILQEFQKDKASYYKYICDMSNCSKHNYNVSPAAKTIDKDGVFTREVYFIEFTKNNIKHESIKVDTILESGFDTLLKLIKGVGDELYYIIKMKN